jgi:hypothetical protein
MFPRHSLGERSLRRLAAPWPILRDLESSEDVLFSLQPLASQHAAVQTELYPSFLAAALNAMSSSHIAAGVSRTGWPGARAFKPIRENGLIAGTFFS